MNREIEVSTGNPAIDRAFEISVALVRELRTEYLESGGKPGWLPVCGGTRTPMVTMHDVRDSAHAVKMAAYLWGDEPDQEAVIENAMYIDGVDVDTGALACNPTEDNTFDRTGYPAVLSGMRLRCAADTYRYFRPGPKFDESLRRAALTAKWIQETYDPEESGLLDCRNDLGKAFWGVHIGEPNHYPPNYDPKSKAICPTMTYAVWLQTMRRVAQLAGSPEEETFARHLGRVNQAIENQAWSERGAYYYLQHDRLADKWFFSLNGLSEDSRETDVIPYYAAEADIVPEHRNAVARRLDRALSHDRVFPMPIFYPPYAWYSPEHPNYIDHGRERSTLGGAWDTSYFHCIELLRESGLTDTLELAVRKRAEAIARDGDCTEWYYLDGTIDNATGYHRDRYLVCGTAQIAATIEGLFGITPAAPHFGEINIAPSLPLFRRHRHSQPPAPYAERDNSLRVNLPEGRRLELTIRYSEADEVYRVRTNNLRIPAHFRLPIDRSDRIAQVRWAGSPVSYQLERLMDSEFIRVDHVLDGGELTVHLRPHPQAGRGTTPTVDMDTSEVRECMP